MSDSINNTNGNKLATILHEDIRTLSDKDVYQLLKTAHNDGNITDTSVLRFYIACHKLAGVMKLIKEDSVMNATICDLGEQYKGQNIDGKQIGYGSTYTSYTLSNPIFAAKAELDEAFKELDLLTPFEKTLKGGLGVTVTVDCAELIEKVESVLNDLKYLNGVSIDLEPPLKVQTFGIKLLKAK